MLVNIKPYKPHPSHLRKHGLVHLIVPVSPVTDQVDDNVLLELLAPFCRYLAHVHHSLRLVSIHMEDWS